MSHPAWRTRANLLTLIRLLLAAPLVLAILNANWWIAATIFSVAVITDFVDGKVARRYNETSAFGGLFDHSTDAAFVTINLWAVAQFGFINHWLYWLVPAAFVQYMLDSKALAGMQLRTSILGKSNGVAYFVVVGVAIGMMLLNWQWLHQPLAWFAWLLVGTTLASMADRAIAFVRSGQD